MGSLSTGQKELLISYYFNCCTEEQRNKAEKILSSNSEAIEIYQNLTRCLGVLDALEEKKCPDYLVDVTVDRYNEMASSQRRLEVLLKEHSKPAMKSGMLSSFAKVAAIAAMVAIVAGVYYPATNHMRAVAMRNTCQDNLRTVASSISSYANDNEGFLPNIQVEKGTPWWQVGSQDDVSHSNTRNLWLLVRGGYAKLNDFDCPAAQNCNSSDIQTVRVSDFRRDFPSKKYIDYSFRLMSGEPVKYENGGRVVLAADSNPLFEERCERGIDSFRKFILTDDMLKASSRNHCGKGQNVMFADGSVAFSRDRNVGEDDIYTIRNMEEYSGIELPAYMDDVFLAP